MAGGPIGATHAIPITASKVFPNTHIGAGAGSAHDRGLGVMASLDGDAIWRLRFPVPVELPSGVAKLRLHALANAAAGAAKVKVLWARVAADQDPSAAALNDEGTATLTWAAGDADKYKELLVPLDAGALAAGGRMVMDLTFETSGWTLAAVSTWLPEIIWE